MRSSKIPTLETERLRMRGFRRSDIDDYAAMNADPEVMHFHGGTWDRGRSWRHLAFLVGHWHFAGAGMWALEHRETGDFGGMVGFAEPEGWPGFELAGTLVRRWWGQGYATEAARAALAHAFTVWKKDRIISLVHPENRASIRVVERLGERLEGRIQHFGREMLVYGIDRETYERRRGLDQPEALLAAVVPSASRFRRSRRIPPRPRPILGLPSLALLVSRN